MSEHDKATSIVPDQYDDLGAAIELDLYLHFSRWLDEPGAEISVRGLPPGITFDPARTMLVGEFGRDTLVDEAYEVRVAVRAPGGEGGTRVLVSTTFRWTVRDRSGGAAVYPPRPAAVPLSTNASGAGAAMLFTLGAQMALLTSARPVAAQTIGVDGARAGFAPTALPTATDSASLRGAAAAPLSAELAITGAIGDVAVEESDLPPAAIGRLRVDPRSRAANEKGSGGSETGGTAGAPTPDDDGDERFTDPPTIVPGTTNTAPLIDPLPTLGQVEDAPILNIDVLSNALDLDGDAMSVRSVRAASGTVLVNLDNTIDYVPRPDFEGNDQITYVVDDGRGGQTTGTINIVVSPVPDAPQAVDDVVAASEDATVTLRPLDNDLDVDVGDTLAIDSVFTTDGTATIVGDTIRYTPDADTFGQQTITYTAIDRDGLTSTATILVEVAPVNDRPVAVADNATINEDSGAVVFSVAGNDTDIDNAVDPSSVELEGAAPDGTVSEPGIGEWSVTPAGDVSFTPAADWFGTATIGYSVADEFGLRSDPATITVTVAPVNDAPNAGTVAPVTVQEDRAVSIDVLTAASDAEGDVVMVTNPTSANGATVSVAPDGRLLYQALPNANGPDTVTYTLQDSFGAETVATVAVDVTPVDDVTVARDDGATGTEDGGTVRIDVLANDSDVDSTIDPASVVIVGAAADGTLAIPGEGVWSVEADGALLFAPEADYNGTSGVEYSVADTNGVRSAPATASVVVTPVNDAPIAADEDTTTDEDVPVNIAVLANDADRDGDALAVRLDAVTNGTAAVLADGSIEFTPDADFAGTATIDYTIEDGAGGTDTATATVTVAPVEDAPRTLADTGAGAEDGAVTIDVVANDFDPDSGDAVDPASVALVGAAPDGTLAIAGEGVWSTDGTGNVLFTPEADYTGTTSAVFYTVADGDGDVSAPTAVTAEITPVNDAPTLDLRGGTTAPTLVAAWYHNDSAAPLRGEIADRSALSSVSAETTGGGLLLAQQFTRLAISGADEAGQAAALAAGDFVDLAFTAAADGSLSQLTFTTFDDGGAFSMSVLVSADGGASFTTLASDVRPAVPSAADHDFALAPRYMNVETIDLAGAALRAGQDHVLRLVVHDVTPTGGAAGEILLDDLGIFAEPQTADTGTLFVEANGPGATGPVALVPAGATAAADAEANIGSISIAVSGIRDTGFETLNVGFDGGAVAIDPEATASYSGTLGGFLYEIDVAGTPGGGTIAVSSGGVPQDGAWVSTLLEALTYDNATAGATAGGRAFAITLADLDGATSAIRTSTIGVAVRNDAATGGATRSATTDEDVAIASIDALAGYSDPDGDVIYVEPGSASASNGTVAINPDGTLLYTPFADVSGPDVISYVITDGNGGRTPATFDIVVNPVNDAPTAADGTATGTNAAPIVIDLTTSISDVDSTLAVADLRFADGTTQVVQPGVGVWDMDTATGRATFTPLVTFVGDATIGYTITDGSALSNVGTLTAQTTDGNVAPTGIEASGLTGTTFNQNGNGALFRLADADAVFAGRTDLRFETTFSIDGRDAQSYAALVSHAGTSGDLFEVGIESGNGPVYLAVEVNGERVNVFGVETLLDGARHALDVAWDNSGAWSVSVDGTLIDSGTGLATGFTMPGGGTTVLGQDQDGPDFDPNEVMTGTFEAVTISSGGTPVADWRFGSSGLDGTAGTISDTLGTSDLVVEQAGQAGFTNGRVVETLTIAEDAAAGTVVATLSTTDDPNNTHTYSLAAVDPFFEIVGNELRLRAGATLDHESEALRTVSVTTTDQGGASFTQDVTIHVANRNEAPSDLGGATFTTGVALNEDGGAGGHFSTGDLGTALDGLTAFTFEAAFSWSDDYGTLASYGANVSNDEVAITLDARSGVQELLFEVDSTILRVPTNTILLNDGATHQLSVTWDNAAGDWQIFVDGVLTNAGTGHAVGHALVGGGTLVVAQDADPGVGVDDAPDAFSGALYDVRLFSGERSAAEIAAGEGVHVDDPSLVFDYRFDDFDGTTVTNAAGPGGDLTYAEAAGLGATGERVVTGIAEDAATGTVVLELAASDPDGGDAITYTILDDPTGGAFRIDGDALVVADASLLDAGTAALHTLTLVGTDIQGAQTPARTFNIRIQENGVNAAPADIVREAFLTGTMLNTDGGNAGHFTLADGGALIGGLTSLSVDTIFAVDGPPVGGSTSYTLLHASGTGGTDQINLAIAELDATPRLFIEIADQTHTLIGYDATALLDGGLHTVSVNWTSGTGAVELFVDGRGVGSISNLATGTVLAGGGLLSIGQGSDPAGFDANEAFAGSIFGTRMFDGTRNAADIAADWNREIDPSTAGLIADWRFSGDDPARVVNEATGAPAGTDLVFGNVAGAGFTAGGAQTLTAIVASAPAGTVVMQLATLDADASDNHTYTIDDPSGTFTISGNSVVVAPGATLDPNAPPVSVAVTTTDLAGATHSETYRIEVLSPPPPPPATALRAGTPGADALVAPAGSELLAYGQGSDDTLTGGIAADELHGQDGADTLSGGAGHDVLHGDRSRQDVDAIGTVAQINTLTTGNQSPPVVATLQDGRSLLVWYGDAQTEGAAGNLVRARFVADDGTPVGREFAIGTAPVELSDAHTMPPLSAVTLADGNVLVTWLRDADDSTDGTSDVVTAVVDVTTGEVSPETVVPSASEQSGAVVVPFADGDAFLVWHSGVTAGTVQGVTGQLIGTDGAAIGGPVSLGAEQLRMNAAFDVPPLAAVALGDGRVLAGWADEGAPNTIIGVVHDVATGTTGATFTLARSAVPVASPPIMTALPGGGAFVVWYGDAAGSNTTGSTLYGQRVATDGSLSGAALDLGTSPVETFDDASQVPVSLLTLANGDVLISYAIDNVTNVDGDRGATGGVMVRADGTVEAERVFSTTTAYEGSAAQVHELGDGRLFAVWVHNPLNDVTGDATGNQSVVRGRFLDADGVPQGTELTLSTLDTEGADTIDLDTMTSVLTVDGDVLVSWATNDIRNADGDGSAVVSALVRTRARGGADILDGGAGDDILVGDGQTYGSAVHELDPVAFWRFESGGGDAVDHSGNGHTAVATDGPTAGTGARAGSTAARLDGVDDHFIVASDPALDLSRGSVVGWFNADAITEGMLISNRSNDPLAGGQFSVFITADGRMGARAEPGTGAGDSIYITEIDAVQVGTWHHFAFVFDETSSELFFDGRSVGSIPRGFALDFAGQDWVIGASAETAPPGDNSSLTRHFEGRLDDVSIHSTRLSETETGALFAANGDLAQSFSDELIGGAGRDVLLGGGGDDLLVGGEGGDVLDGGAGTDTADYSASASGIDAVFSASDGGGIEGIALVGAEAGGRTGDAAGDTYSSIERVIGTAFADRIYGADEGMTAQLGAGDDVFDNRSTSNAVDTIEGGDGADRIYGGGGNDTLSGDGGDDRLFGENGDDTLRGGAGDDTLVGGTGADVLDGGDGFDTADYSAASTGVDVLLSDTDQYGIADISYQNTAAGGQTGEAAGDSYSSIERVIGTAFDDRVYGSEAGVIVELGAGDDIFDNANTGPVLADRTAANDGNDTVYGGTGTDVLFGGYGNDELYGEEGNDTIEGGDGDDLLVGGGGDDFLDGGAGVDTIRLRGSEAAFDIRDNGDGTFTAFHLAGGQDGTDTFSNIEAVAFGANPAVSLADIADSEIVGTAGNETLIGGGGDDTIYGLDGEDTIDGGAGDDTIYAGANRDVIAGGAGDDLIDGGGGDSRATFSGARSDYLIHENPDASFTITDIRPGSPDGTDILIDVKFVSFLADGTTIEPKNDPDPTPAYTIVGNDAAVPETVTGTAGDDRIDGRAGEDRIEGLAGDDLLYGGNDQDTLVGGAGNDFLDGGAGDDTAVFSGNLADYSIHLNSNGSYTVTDNRPGRPDGRDILFDIKFIQFADGTVEPKDHDVASPIAFDLDSSGLIETTGATTARERPGVELGETVGFDMDGDGDLEAIEWLSGGGDALLVDDSDGRALEDMNGTRLFGDQGGTFSDGYAQLSERDADGDGRIAGAEAEGLALWVDDGDAEAEEGELFTLADFGIEAISLSTRTEIDGEGRELMRADAVRTDGTRVMTEDVWFGVDEDQALRLRPSDDDLRMPEEVV